MNATATLPLPGLTHLQALAAESIQIMREVLAAAERTVVVY